MLYIVSTPIGNLEDITLRAISMLQSVDFILSEDTRVTHKLLKYFDINTPTISFHDHSDESKYEQVFELLHQEKDLALVTDAGTPGISDPGAFLVKKVKELMPDVSIRTIPGASALTAAISISGVDIREFTFLGFPPHKKGRRTFFENVAQIIQERPAIFYESTHRLQKALESLKSVAPDSNVVIAKELTKIYESTLEGKPSEILEFLEQNPEKIKGEFVIIVW
jgi:16S rRNA (cytidine1402-2'-O)-methyltransferase